MRWITRPGCGTKTAKPRGCGEHSQQRHRGAEEPRRRCHQGYGFRLRRGAQARRRARIKGLGRAVHGAADEIGKEIPAAADYVHTAASTLESAADELRNRSIEDLIGTFTRFARQQPAAAFAGAVLAGFVLSRFLKSAR